VGGLSGEERSARVQLLFRDVNERIRRLGEELLSLGSDDEIEIVCECVRPSCATRIAVPASAYGWVRERPRCFIVLPGHERLDVERVVERHGSHLVVEKDEALLERAVATGPAVGEPGYGGPDP
jgi:hypothetical protein